VTGPAERRPGGVEKVSLKTYKRDIRFTKDSGFRGPGKGGELGGGRYDGQSSDVGMNTRSRRGVKQRAGRIRRGIAGEDDTLRQRNHGANLRKKGRGRGGKGKKRKAGGVAIQQSK